MTSLRIATLAALVLIVGCRDWRPIRPSWPDRGQTGLRTLGLRRSVVYPYSVIAGGVESKADVRDAVGRDPQVARHYDDVSLGSLEPEHLKSDTLAYVSFRKNGQIYWTSKPVLLAKGERILSDGRNCVRGRCGNRISSKPRSPVLPKEFREPDSAMLNTPEVRGQSIDEAALPPVFATRLNAGELPVSVASVVTATGMPSPTAPAFIGAGGNGEAESGVSGGGGGGGAPGMGGAQSGAAGELGRSNFIPAILYAVTGAPMASVAVPAGLPPVGTAYVPPGYRPAVSSLAPPMVWNNPLPRTGTPGSVVFHWTSTPGSPSTPTNPTPGPPAPNILAPPPTHDDSAKPKPPAPPLGPPTDTPPEASVPEPATFGFMAAGLAGLLVVRSRFLKSRSIGCLGRVSKQHE